MKERPILFSGSMVNAILEGRKTQTRRIVKPQPPENFCNGDVAAITNGERWAFSNTGWSGGKRGAWPQDPAPGILCPHGQPGDRLWVRETWKQTAYSGRNLATDSPIHEAFIDYAAGGSRSFLLPHRADACDAPNRETGRLPWRPSIHMPRWASRILLEITSVRVERLQEISDDDCHSEGAIKCARPDEFSVHSCIGIDGYAYLSPLGAFHGLWTKINGRDSWNANPWVWVIEFKRIQP